MMGSGGTFTVLLALVIAGVAAQNSLSWIAGSPSHMGSEDRYIAHVEYTTEESRNLRVRILQGSELYGAATVRVDATDAPKKASIFAAFTEDLVPGQRYRVEILMLALDGTTVRTLFRELTAVRDKIRFANGSTSIGRESGYELELIYTATVERSIVIAVKEPTDSTYLGSRRVNVPAGVNRRTTITIGFGGAGGTLPAGQRAILRADIRPVDGIARTRLDRVERRVTAGGGSQPTATPSASVAWDPVPTEIVVGRVNTFWVATYSPTDGNAAQIHITDSARRTIIRRQRRVPRGASMTRFDVMIEDNYAAGPTRARALIVPRGFGWARRVAPVDLAFPELSGASPPPTIAFSPVPSVLRAGATNTLRFRYTNVPAGHRIEVRIKTTSTVFFGYEDVTSINGFTEISFEISESAPRGTTNTRIALVPRNGGWDDRIGLGVFATPELV